MAYYWVAINGKQVDLPFDNLDAAMRLLLKHIGEDKTVLALIEVYDGDHPMRQIMWNAETQYWIEVP